MKKVIFLVLVFTTSISFGQKEQPVNKTISESFIENYNQNGYKLIFAMFSKEMQDALPLSNTVEFLTGIKSQLGSITNKEFITYENGTYASYKTIFERGIIIVNISVDNQSKINGLFVKPYIEESKTETIINKLSLKNNLITKKQSEIIFNKAKNFPNNTQVAIAIIKNEKVNFYGIKREGDSLTTIINHKSIFEIGSITKVFTSTLLSGFVIDKKITLNENINNHIDVSLKDDVKISFLELSNHTSGLPRLPSNLDLTKVNPTNPYKDYDEDDLKNYLENSLELPSNLIKKNEYSNLGSGLLSYVLSDIEGISFEDLLQNRIFSKYNMLNSTAERSKVKGAIVKGLDSDGNEVSNWDFSVLAGAGSILSNVEDMSKFAIEQFNNFNKELELTRQKTFQINDNMGIGLGWHIIKTSSGNDVNWHNGGTGGYSSSMIVDVENKNGIIILSNVSTFNPKMENIDALCFELIKTLKK